MSEIEPNNALYQDFLDELYYKIWSTKESLFNANKRLIKLSKSAKQCYVILSIYFAALSLLFLYNIYNESIMSQTILNSSILLLLLLLLVLGKIKNTSDYHTKANEYHQCGLELSSLYNILIVFKTLIDNQPLENKKQFTQKLATSYQKIIDIPLVHESIDTDVFKSKTSKYHNLNWFDVQIIKVKYYFRTSFLFDLLIIFPPLLLFILL